MLRLFSTVATFGTPLDVAASELAIETFVPADAETSAWLAASEGGNRVAAGAAPRPFEPEPVGVRISAVAEASYLASADVGPPPAPSSDGDAPECSPAPGSAVVLPTSPPHRSD